MCAIVASWAISLLWHYIAAQVHWGRGRSMRFFGWEKHNSRYTYFWLIHLSYSWQHISECFKGWIYAQKKGEVLWIWKYSCWYSLIISFSAGRLAHRHGSYRVTEFCFRETLTFYQHIFYFLIKHIYVRCSSLALQCAVPQNMKTIFISFTSENCLPSFTALLWMVHFIWNKQSHNFKTV